MENTVISPAQNFSGTAINEVIHGWKSSGNDRGTIDVLWSSAVTIILCCWVSTYPNVGSPKDKWYHTFYDKLSLAIISLLGPDFVFGIAFGQFCSARRSVEMFRRDSHLCNGTRWTYTHGFFVDMGGIHLVSPDFPEGFPINAAQLHYLVSHKYVDFPDMEQMAIAERNSLDTLSRVITVFQAFWFLVAEIQRVRIGLPMTTLELTALSFSFIMFATSLLWYAKPSITKPRPIKSNAAKTVAEIREFARQNTHPQLSEIWYRTPLDFISRNQFRIDAHWSYYVRLAQMMHFPFISRPIRSRPWDRFPSDEWLCPDMIFAPLAAAVLVGFSVLFLFAWNFHFPTKAEQLLWRISSVYHAFFCLYGGLYYLIEMFNCRRRAGPSKNEQTRPPVHEAAHETLVDDLESQTFDQVRWLPETGMFRVRRQVETSLQSLRNISPDQDPDRAVPLRIIFPVTVICFLYILCRLFIYFEDFFALRLQLAGIYVTVNKFIPFLGG
ncbi:hypothetical protein HDK77DRAFT_211610 [Phyllosticta capitalensis]